MLKSHIKKTWQLLSKHKTALALMSFIDLVFFVSIAFIYQDIFFRAVDHLIAIDQILSQNAQALTQELLVQQDVSALMASEPQFLFHYNEIIKFVIIFFAAVLLAWIVLQGLNWWLSNNIVRKKKTKFWDYFLKFSVLSIAQLILLLLILFLSVNLSLKASMTITPLLGQNFVNVIVIVLFVLLVYFSFLSYTLIPFKGFVKKTFKLGVRHFRTFIPMFLFSAIVLFLAGFVFSRLFPVNYVFALLFGVLITLPSFSFVRMFILRTVDGVMG